MVEIKITLASGKEVVLTLEEASELADVLGQFQDSQRIAEQERKRFSAQFHQDLVGKDERKYPFPRNPDITLCMNFPFGPNRNGNVWGKAWG